MGTSLSLKMEGSVHVSKSSAALVRGWLQGAGSPPTPVAAASHGNLAVFEERSERYLHPHTASDEV